MGSKEISLNQAQPKPQGLQYFSKWRNEWVDFKVLPTIGEINSYSRYHYQIREKP